MQVVFKVADLLFSTWLIGFMVYDGFMEYGFYNFQTKLYGKCGECFTISPCIIARVHYCWVQNYSLLPQNDK